MKKSKLKRGLKALICRFVLVRSFYAASCGGAPIEVLKKYVQDQGKAALKGGVSTQEKF